MLILTLLSVIVCTSPFPNEHHAESNNCCIVKCAARALQMCCNFIVCVAWLFSCHLKQFKAAKHSHCERDSGEAEMMWAQSPSRRHGGSILGACVDIWRWQIKMPRRWSLPGSVLGCWPWIMSLMQKDQRLTLHRLYHTYPPITLCERIIIHTFSICKPSLWEVKTCLESHPVLERQNWYLIPGLCDLESCNPQH